MSQRNLRSDRVKSDHEISATERLFAAANPTVVRPRLVTKRVRSDELLVTDLVEVNVYGAGRRFVPVVSLAARRYRTPGGATVTRYVVDLEDILTFTCAPHAKHTVRRSV